MKNINPSQRVTCLSWVTKKNKIVPTNKTNNPLSRTSSGISNLPVNLGIPITINELKILDPRTFPTAISGFPFLAAEMVTISSGNDVPSATALKAINSLPTSNISEILVTDLIV